MASEAIKITTFENTGNNIRLLLFAPYRTKVLFQTQL
jgi:hypothetical protein